MKCIIDYVVNRPADNQPFCCTTFFCAWLGLFCAKHVLVKVYNPDNYLAQVVGTFFICWQFAFCSFVAT